MSALPQLQTLLALHNSDPKNAEHRSAFLRSLSVFILELERKGEHLYHSYPQMYETMGIWSLPLENPSIQQLTSKIAKDLNGCVECIEAFYACKRRYSTHLKGLHYEADKIADLQAKISRWNVERHLAGLGELLGKFQSAKGDLALEKAIRQDGIFLIFEILNYPESLKDPELDKQFLRWLHAAQSKRPFKLKMLKNIYPGIFLLIAHNSPYIRAWGNALLASSDLLLRAEDVEGVVPILQTLLAKVENFLVGRTLRDHVHDSVERRTGFNLVESESDVWEALATIFALIPDDCLQLYLTDTCSDPDRLFVLSLSASPDVCFWPRLKLITRILQRTTLTTWLHTIPPALGKNFFKKVMSTDFTLLSQTASDSPQPSQRIAFSWIPVLVRLTGATEWILESLQTWTAASRQWATAFRAQLHHTLLDMYDVLGASCLRSVCEYGKTLGMDGDVQKRVDAIVSECLVLDLNQFYGDPRVLGKGEGRNGSRGVTTIDFPIWDMLDSLMVSNVLLQDFLPRCIDLCFKGYNVRVVGDEGFNTCLKIVCEKGAIFLGKRLADLQLSWRDLLHLLIFNNEQMQLSAETASSALGLCRFGAKRDVLKWKDDRAYF